MKIATFLKQFIRTCAIVLIVSAAATLSSCDVNKSEKYKFVNNSSYTVYVYPESGQSWSTFSVDSGNTYTVTQEGDCRFTHSLTSYVRYSTSSNTFTFTDK